MHGLAITSYIPVDTGKNHSINPQLIAVHTSRFPCSKTRMTLFQGITRENQNSSVEPCSKKGSPSSGECASRFDLITSCYSLICNLSLVLVTSIP